MNNKQHNTFASNTSSLRVVAIETTKACTLACPHCRASAVLTPDNNELKTEEICKLFKDIAKINKCLIILSGGEPLLRKDLEILAQEAVKAGHRPVVSCNDGSLLTETRLESLKKAGITHYSFSMHFNNETEHDNFVKIPGTFNNALKAFERIKKKNLSFQVNTSVLPGNYNKLEEIKDWVISLNASSWHLFFIVPTGRATLQNNQIIISQKQTEKVLLKIAKEADEWPIPVKVTCAPQYARIRTQLGKKQGQRGRSCMAGRGFAFISYKGEVKPCGYFDLIVGNIRNKPFDEIYNTSKELAELSNPDNLTQICGQCKFKVECGGCRARAYAVNKSYLADDPYCKFTGGDL